jgi:adenylate cyclase
MNHNVVAVGFSGGAVYMTAERLQRRLAAILSADVVGYSRLMGLDEAGTLSRLNALRRGMIDPAIAAHSGRIVKLMGDGALVEFASAVDAVTCAIEIQKQFMEHDAGGSDADPIRFRIGINIGDIIIEGNDILGDGVNIAVRIEGGISISEDVWRQVQGKVAADFVDIGEQSLKNIATPVRVYRVQLGEGSATKPTAPALALPDKPSIAVLPFQNMSGDVEQDYFCDGMVEEIITGLSRIKWLFVIARNSSFVYKGKSIDVKQVGRELGVRYVLEGSVRKAANRVRITGQLIEAESGAHLWAERYDRPLEDVFALQDEITLCVVGAIEPSLRQAEIERVKRKRPNSLDAYDLVLKAIPHIYTVMPDGAAKAIPLLTDALALEPDYALAHGFAAWGHEILFVRAGMHEENRRSAIRHAHEAIAHGRGDAMALTLGGFVVSIVERDRVAAVEAFEAALGVSPSSAFTYLLGGSALGWAGEAKRAITWGERGLRLSPVDLPFGPFIAISLGNFQLQHYTEAANAARRAIQANPGFTACHVLFAAALAKSGRIDQAKAAAANVLALQPSFTVGGFCAGFGIPPPLATPLSEALHDAGLPD